MRRRDFLQASATLPILGAIGFPRAASAQGVPENSITVSDASGEGISNCPLRIARPFIRGEIHGIPQAVIEGNPVPTQVDVKTRWPDGSVQHAILSFIILRLHGDTPLKIGFAPQSAAPEPAIDPAQFLAPRFNFDAQIQITRDGKTEAVSARKMLEDGSFVTWCKGPIATTLILADHSVRRKYDFGFESLRPIRPIFHATFWPSIGQVFVRAVAENSNTESLQDVEYDVRLTAGHESPGEMFRQAGIIHQAGTRWTRRFWIGANHLPQLDIDHNIAYLAATRAFPNFDSSLRIPEGVLAETYNKWLAKPRNLYDRGDWMKGMGSSGGRDDIGPYTGYEGKWLLSGDRRMLEIVETQADLAGAWPLQVREGNAQKRYDRAQKVSALGRPISIFARPSLWLLDDRDKSNPQDSVPVHGARITVPGSHPWEGWDVDNAHTPDPYSALYTLTGDYFALEQLQLWVSALALRFDPGYKGPAPSGGIFDQVRGDAWGLRDRVHAATLSPDGTPEKQYFRGLIDDAVAYWEGAHNIHGTQFDGTPLWTFARGRWPADNPLHVFGENPKDKSNTPDILNLSEVGTAAPLWQTYLLIFELGRAREQGYPTGALLSYCAKVLTGQFAESATYNPYNIARLSVGVRDREGRYFKTWTEALRSYNDPVPPPKFVYDPCDGYSLYAYGASTMIVHEPGGAAAYEWLRDHVYEPMRQEIGNCGKWAYLPRP